MTPATGSGMVISPSEALGSCGPCCLPVGPRPACEAAQHAARPRHPLNPYWQRICGRQEYKKAVVAIAQRLARILYAMWRKREDFDATQLNVVEEERIRTRTYYWRLKKPDEQFVVA